jgi:hypothetical protein
MRQIVSAISLKFIGSACSIKSLYLKEKGVIVNIQPEAGDKALNLHQLF